MTTSANPRRRERLFVQGMEGQRSIPTTLKAEEMLAFYASRLPTVEINNTFYRMPKTSVLESWASQRRPRSSGSPSRRRAASRTSRGSRPNRRRSRVGYLYRSLAALGEKRGPVLFQLPPNLKKDLPRLEAFLGLLPGDHRAAFEFRNDTWFSDDVYAALKAAGASLCLSEREDNAPPPLVETAPWGYVRLRLETYSDADLQAWARRLEATSWRQIHVYFMHEPTAPAYAKALMEFASRLAAAGAAATPRQTPSCDFLRNLSNSKASDRLQGRKPPFGGVTRRTRCDSPYWSRPPRNPKRA